jgi:hypothetical protein
MSERPSIAPVVKKVLVPGAGEEAFALFTERLGQWWPRDTHSVGGPDCTEVHLEGRVGGRVYEVTADGAEHEWGRITAWDPGRRLTMTWHPGLTSEQATTVDLTFRPTPSGTEVRLVHDGWGGRGESGAEVRDRYDHGWDVVLGHVPTGRVTSWR